MPNRLASETSPYLLQHANNPVDWFPWGEEAFAKAKAEDKPIFLSVGYSACHWCHVMEHESFEDEAVAKILNERFVPVKVDREERPDVDEAYMTAVQLTSGRGGWPMSVFLTPERLPFFAGTYFPKENRGSHPGFLAVCNGISESWVTRRSEIESSAEQIADALASSIGRRAPGAAAEFSQEFVDLAVRTLLSDYDVQHGGFGGAPKFPPHSALGFLLTYAVLEGGPDDLRQNALGASLETLHQMCLSGIHDRVGGGFHRYATDAEWRLPHFEKMLYDNALMLKNLARAALVCEEAAPDLTHLFVTASQGIAHWLHDEMTSPDGLFYCALDADSEGEEGKYYVWTQSEIEALIPSPEFSKTFGIRAEGNFFDEATHRPTGANVLHIEPGNDEFRWDWPAEFEALRRARAERVRPGTDDKALIGWNGLMIGALAEVGIGDMAMRAADRILAVEAGNGGLPRGIAKGRSFGEAFLEDYAYFTQGLLRLAEWAEEEGRGAPYRAHAVRLAQEMRQRFYDDVGGGFFATGDRHEDLFGRSKPFLDQPIPSANAAAMNVMLELGQLDDTEATLRALLGWMERVPTATEALYEAALPLLGIEPIDVRVSLSDTELVVDEEDWGDFEVRFSVPEGYHLNTHQPEPGLTPTEVIVENGRVEYPSGVDGWYVGDFALPVRLHGEGERTVRVRFQTCSETECRLPQEVELKVRLLSRGA